MNLKRAICLKTSGMKSSLWFALSVDFFALRDGMLVGVLELKSRSHTSTTYSTVFLNVRKWGSLMLYHLGGCPASLLSALPMNIAGSTS